MDGTNIGGTQKSILWAGNGRPYSSRAEAACTNLKT